MQQFLIFLLSFLNFWFYPFIVLFILALGAELIIRRTSSELNILRAMTIRKFLFRQNILLNLSWFAVLFLLMIMQRGSSPTVNTDIVWRGY